MTDVWEFAFASSFAEVKEHVLALVPNVLVMAATCVVGWAIAWGMGRLSERVLRVVGLDHLCDRLGVNAALLRSGIKTDPSRLVGRGTYWTLVMISAVAGLSALNVPAANAAAHSVFTYLLRLLVASVVLFAGYLFSNFVSQTVLISAVNAGVPPARLMAACARGFVQLAAVAMALEQIGIAENIVTIGFGILLGGGVLAGAIAIGWGARDLAKELLERTLSTRRVDRPADDLRHW
jgi:hypothetical protein